MVDVYYRPITIEGTAEALASMLNRPLKPLGPLPPLGGLALPTLVGVGAFDKVLPPDAADEYLNGIAGARREVFARSGHVPHEEEPAAFNARLREFLAEIP